MRRIAFGTILIAASAALLPAHEAEAKYCPRVLYRATRLVVVSVPNMQSTAASVRTFERMSPAARWEQRGESEPAVVGAQGIAWGNPYVSFAKKDEPLKREGDERTPAGVYRFGATFGFAANKLPGHLLLQPAKQFCVHDVSSRYYGQIVDKRVAGEKTSGENMAKFPLYKRGIVIDYPARPQSKAGLVHLPAHLGRRGRRHRGLRRAPRGAGRLPAGVGGKPQHRDRDRVGGYGRLLQGLPPGLQRRQPRRGACDGSASLA